MQQGGVSSTAALSAVAATRPPIPLTRLVGRSREVDELEELMSSSRLLTLTGVGGAGKTRLASEVARRIADTSGIPAAWVELGACGDPQLVAQQAAAAFSLRETSDRGPLGALVELLRDRRVLIVLDNCEHMIEPCVEVASALLAQCRDVAILATSREPLGIAGEKVWPVPPLVLPDESNARTICESDAVQLFVDRATAADASFRLTTENAPAVAEICRRLDGIPLAIELAAARVRLLTPEQIADRLTQGFAFLSGASRSAAPRHRTLRAAIDWSFELLSEAEQNLLLRLSVFAGCFSLDAAELVCSDDELPRDTILELLGGLVDKSLVIRDSRASKPRFSMLGTIANYAAERLEESGRTNDYQRRHATAFRDLARIANPLLMRGSLPALHQLDEDRDNLRAALAWSIEHEPDSIGLPLAAALRWYWYYGIRWSEGVRWLAKALETSGGRKSPDRASATTALGTLTAYLGDSAAARRLLLESEALWRESGDDLQLAFNLSALAQLFAGCGEVEAAAKFANESIAIARRCGNNWDIGYCLTNASAFVAQVEGDFEEADRCLAEAEQIWSADRHPLGYPFVLNARALLALRRNDHEAAARLARAALGETRERHELWFSSRSLRIIAFTSGDEPLRAARLLGAADCMLQTMTAGMLLHEKAEHERVVTSLNEKLSPVVLQEAMEQGRNMTFEEACELAMSRSDAPSVSIVVEEDAPSISVHDLGSFRVALNGRLLENEGRASARGRELFAFLLAHPSGRTKEEVGVALWPDAAADQLKNSFHVTLHRVRKVLGAKSVVVTDGRYRVNPDLALDVSSRRFEEKITRATKADAASELEAALSLYEGDYLQGEEMGDWLLPIRSHLRKLFLRGLFELGGRFESRGRYAEAAETYGRITAREPFHEAALRQLMICRARLGARSESLVMYRDFEHRLRDELSAQPEPETVTLYRRLQQNDAV